MSEIRSPQIQAALRRTDYRIILDMVEPEATVLDLGCGSGHLLLLLEAVKHVTGYGVELAQEQIIECVENGLSVFQGDIDEGLRDFEDNSFDYVILNQTLPVTHRPEFVISEMLRVGAKSIVSFPNFAHWRVRLSLLFSGHMPVTEAIPFHWHDTPNIHHLTVRDFRLFSRRHAVSILRCCFFSRLEDGRINCNMWWPSGLAGYGLFVIRRGG